MPTVKNNLNGGGVIQVALSDERMAAVEESKRTGQPVQSIGARGSEYVKRDDLLKATREDSAQKYGSGEYPVQDHLHEMQENLEDRGELNQKLAAEHQEVSNEIVNRQREARRQRRSVRRDSPMDSPSTDNATLNAALAADYAQTVNQYAEQKARDRHGIEQEIRKIQAEDVDNPNPQTVLGRLAKEQPTDISQSADDEALKQKDRIAYGVDAFTNQAFAARKFGQQAAKNNRAQSLDYVDASEGNVGEEERGDGGSREDVVRQFEQQQQNEQREQQQNDQQQAQAQEDANKQQKSKREQRREQRAKSEAENDNKE